VVYPKWVPGGNSLRIIVVRTVALGDDLLRLYAEHYLNIARAYENFLSGSVLPEDGKPTPEEFKRIIGQCRGIVGFCTHMHLSVSARAMNRIIGEFEKELPSNATGRQRFIGWYTCFQSEIEERVYLTVLPHRVPYWSSLADGLEGIEVGRLVKALKNFKDAKFDAEEAGNCFAFERFTACVYHLMRVAEFGLVSVARTIGVANDKLDRGWDGCIQGIESEIKKIESTKPADWIEQKKKYSDLCSWFGTIQRGWRNPVSHIPRIYSEDTAKGMFGATVTLFDHLNGYGFAQQ